jgi:hypothetical protein
VEQKLQETNSLKTTDTHTAFLKTIDTRTAFFPGKRLAMPRPSTLPLATNTDYCPSFISTRPLTDTGTSFNQDNYLDMTSSYCDD